MKRRELIKLVPLSAIGVAASSIESKASVSGSLEIKWKRVVYHFYTAVGKSGRVIAVATSKEVKKNKL
jgi:hypothetical protein